MQIFTLDTSVDVPVQVKVRPEQSHPPVPLPVEEAAEKGKLWHVLAWVDETENQCGVYCKRMGISIQRSAITDASIEVMRPAKGQGWVSLSVRCSNVRGRIALLESPYFSERALTWLIDRSEQFEALLGMKIPVQELGTDY